jgi:glucose/arabinose dehydrogenase
MIKSLNNLIHLYGIYYSEYALGVFCMCFKAENWPKLNINTYSQEVRDRNLNPMDINLPIGYRTEVFATGLDAPSCMVFTEDGELIIAESGLITGEARVLRMRNGLFEVVADDFRAPITGLHYHNGGIYVSHKGNITLIRLDGTRHNILTGLPSNGDYGNSNVFFGSDGKFYFGQGTATNSAVVGVDNEWVRDHPFIHDNPGTYVMLNGQNYSSKNILSMDDERVYTGAFSPFGEANMPYEIRKGVIRASGSIMRANPDGTGLELFAWGFRYPSQIKFDNANRLFVANQGYEIRGSRPIANAADEFHLVKQGLWYGWPDYSCGEPVTSSRFQPDSGVQSEFLLTSHPNVPPRPYAIFPPDSYIMGFDFNYNERFGPYGDVYIAEFGSAGRSANGSVTPYTGSGHRISKINMNSGGITTFAINKSGFPASITREGGFGRPVDIAFGPDGAMYVLDLGTNAIDNLNLYYPNTGVLWRISKE